MAQNGTKASGWAARRATPAGFPASFMNGKVLVKLLVGIPLALVAALILTVAFYEGRKAYWDWRVQQMCDQDGGVKIVERVSLTADEAASMPRSNGYLSVRVKEATSSIDPVFGVMKTFYIRDIYPQISRFETTVIRRSDMKLVATIVRYSRVGGDPPLPAHPSVFSCPSIQDEIEDLAKLFQLTESVK